MQIVNTLWYHNLYNFNTIRSKNLTLLCSVIFPQIPFLPTSQFQEYFLYCWIIYVMIILKIVK